MSSSPATHTATQIPSPKANLVLTTVTTASPDPYELLIKNACIATCPIDWKQQAFDVRIPSYPTTLGSDISGTVISIGSSVTRFRPGDRITAFAPLFLTRKAANGAFQEYTLATEDYTAHIPDNISFEDAATLPMAIATAGTAIFHNMGLPRPPLSEHLVQENAKTSFLVWGAASSVGSVAVQIARSLNFHVLATASPKHHAYIKSLGAAEVFDYRSETVVADLVAAGADAPIRYGFDAISEKGTTESSSTVLVKSMGDKGGAKISLLLLSPDNTVAEGVEVTTPGAGPDLKAFGEFRKWLFPKWLEGVLKDGTIVPSPEVQIVEGGLGGLQKALDLHRSGVSGKKLVVKVGEGEDSSTQRGNL